MKTASNCQICSGVQQSSAAALLPANLIVIRAQREREREKEREREGERERNGEREREREREMESHFSRFNDEIEAQSWDCGRGELWMSSNATSCDCAKNFRLRRKVQVKIFERSTFLPIHSNSFYSSVVFGYFFSQILSWRKISVAVESTFCLFKTSSDLNWKIHINF